MAEGCAHIWEATDATDIVVAVRLRCTECGVTVIGIDTPSGGITVKVGEQ